MTQQYHIDSDSSSSARILDPIILWTSENGNRRLAFLPHLHHNPNLPEACLSGQLIINVNLQPRHLRMRRVFN